MYITRRWRYLWWMIYTSKYEDMSVIIMIVQTKLSVSSNGLRTEDRCETQHEITVREQDTECKTASDRLGYLPKKICHLSHLRAGWSQYTWYLSTQSILPPLFIIITMYHRTTKTQFVFAVPNGTKIGHRSKSLPSSRITRVGKDDT